MSVLHFGDRGWRLGYARDAANSYFVFSQMRKEGVLPRHLKFQVALPMPYSAVTSFFPDAAEHPVVVRAITDAIAEEIACIVDQIPPEDLAIQLDLAVENRYIEKTLEQSGLDAARREVDRLVSPAATLCKRIPAATALGFHSCYGTIIGWPTRKPRSLAGSVLLANAFARYAGRAVDFVHVPTVERADEDYFRPLEQLETGDARLYLGLIHHLHGADGIRRQIHVARKFRADFGIAAPCGFGRVREKPGGLVPGDVRAHNYLEAIIGDHEAAVAILKEGPPRRDAGGRPIGASAGVVR
ncbi:MAG: hypothetical protein AB7V13_08885 [Pseudorhodoplanes sp.]|uniref:hypothetical protein n=1 Tax=Pseudorhodoplanes sp. TaxID=1934341 RepID=UPI003D151ECB